MEDTFLTKEQWVEAYSGLILRAFARGQSALGYDPEHAEFVQEELSEYYYDPVKRSFIESAYPPDYVLM